MAKIPTSWTSNPNKDVNTPAYSSSSTQYSSSSVYYSSATSNLDQLNKLATSWSSNAKIASMWTNGNYLYDTTYLYDDATLQYDFVNSTTKGLIPKIPVSWSEV